MSTIPATPAPEARPNPKQCGCLDRMVDELAAQGVKIHPRCRQLTFTGRHRLARLRSRIGFPLVQNSTSGSASKYRQFLIFTHCPFCGQAYPE